MHSVRRIYDSHLKDFLREWLEDGVFPIDPGKFLLLTDNEVTVSLFEAARDKKAKGHDPARRIVKREHFKLVYERNEADIKINPEAAKAVYSSLCEKYGEENVKIDKYKEESIKQDFPVRKDDGRIVSSIVESDVLNHLPITAFEYVFIRPDLEIEAKEFFKLNR